MITGHCLCGDVEYEYEGTISELVICHCSQCQRAQGAAFAVNAPVDRNLFKFIKGKELLKAYESSPEKKRVFCSNCGSPIYSAHVDKPGIYRLRAGTITSTFERTPDYQQYCKSKANWIELGKHIPAYQQKKN